VLAVVVNDVSQQSKSEQNMTHKILILILFLAFSFENIFAEDRPLKLGAILPLTGKASTVGVSIQNGMMMAYDGLPTEIRNSFIIQFENDASESRNTVTAAQRLISEGGVDILLTALSNAGNAVVPITERAKVPLLSLAYDRKISNGKECAFTFWVDVNDLASAAINEASRRGYHRIAIASTIHEGNIAMRETLMNVAHGKVEFLLLEGVPLDETDLATHALRLRKAKSIDAVAILMHAAHLGLFAKTLRDNRITLPLFTLGNFEDQNARVSSSNALKGQWYSATNYSPWFLPDYRAKFPNDSTFGAAFGHDAVLLLAEASKGSSDRVALCNYLKSGHVSNGAISEVVSDEHNGFRFPATIKVVGEDGIDY
jgi:ABC-type branched-subunit amino acid transport system substrate-binding protein